VTLDQDSALSRAFGRRSGGWKSRAPLRPGCGLVTEPPCTVIGGHSGRVLKRPGMAAPARRRIRMIMAGTRPWGVVWALGSLPALTGPWHAGQMPAAFPPSLRRFAVRVPGPFQGWASVVAACGRRGPKRPGRTRVRVSSPTIMPGEPDFGRMTTNDEGAPKSHQTTSRFSTTSRCGNCPRTR